MAPGSILVGISIICAFVAGASGHICIISPHQRGDMNVSQPGNKTCTRHGFCGGMPAETPRTTYVGGSTVFVTFQQNLNHYEVGYPGYMDIAWANSTSTTATFNTVGVFGDDYEHAQANQQNYSLPFVVPDIDCAHCVLRGRYISHKPGERPFLQCSDIVIKPSQTEKPSVNKEAQPPQDTNPNPYRQTLLSLLENKKRLSDDGALLYGFTWNPVRPGSALVIVDPLSGQVHTISSLYFGMGSGVQYGTPSTKAGVDTFAMDQIACFNREMPYMTLLEHRSGGLDVAPDKIIWVNVINGQVVGEYDLKTQVPIQSMVPYQGNLNLAFQIKELQNDTGNFVFQYATLSNTGAYTLLYTTQVPEPNYVNYMWATLDYTTKMHYALIGHEDKLYTLNARIHTFNATSRNLSTAVELDVSQYTFSSIQVYEKTGELFAMSPGLFSDKYPAWTLVKVNPKDGSVKKMFQITPDGVFEHYYGGGVINIDQVNGVLFYVLRVANTQNDVIAAISLTSGKVTFSKLTDVRDIHNLAFYKPLQV